MDLGWTRVRAGSGSLFLASGRVHRREGMDASERACQGGQLAKLQGAHSPLSQQHIMQTGKPTAPPRQGVPVVRPVLGANAVNPGPSGPKGLRRGCSIPQQPLVTHSPRRGPTAPELHEADGLEAVLRALAELQTAAVRLHGCVQLGLPWWFVLASGPWGEEITVGHQTPEPSTAPPMPRDQTIACRKKREQTPMREDERRAGIGVSFRLRFLFRFKSSPVSQTQFRGGILWPGTRQSADQETALLGP